MDKNYIINQSRFTEQVQYSPNGAILFSYKNNLDESTNAINSHYYKEVKNDNNYKLNYFSLFQLNEYFKLKKYNLK